MDVADCAALIEDGEERHASQLEKIDFLLIATSDVVVRIGHAREWKLVLGPVSFERLN